MGDELPDLSKGAAVLVGMVVAMTLRVRGGMRMRVGMLAFPRMSMSVGGVAGVRMCGVVVVVMMVVIVVVIVIGFEMNLKLRTGDAAFLTAIDVQMIPVEVQMVQALFQLAGIEAKVEQGADKHVAANSAEEI